MKAEESTVDGSDFASTSKAIPPGRVVRDFTRITQGGREITYEWPIRLADLPKTPESTIDGPELGKRWRLHLSCERVKQESRIGVYLVPILTSAEELTGCRRHIDVNLAVWLVGSDDFYEWRPLRRRSLTAKVTEANPIYGWPDCISSTEYSYNSESLTAVKFAIEIREPSLKATTQKMDLNVRPQRIATTVADCCDPRALPDVLFNVHGRQLVAFSDHLRYSTYLTKMLDSPRPSFPLPLHMAMFPEGEPDGAHLDGESPMAPSSSSSGAMADDLQAEDSDYEDDDDLEDPGPDSPIMQALKPHMKHIEVKEFAYITFRALLQYGHSGILTFAPHSTTFRKKILPEMKALFEGRPEGGEAQPRADLKITRLNAAAIEHASSTFGAFKSTCCSPKSLYRIARVHRAPVFTQKCFEAIVAGWVPEAVLEELSLKFYKVYAAAFLPDAKEFLISHWEEISASPTFGADLAGVFTSGNPQLIEAVTTALGSLSGEKERSKRRKVQVANA